MTPQARTTAGRLRTWRPGPFGGLLGLAVFAVSATLQIIGVPGTSSFGTRTRFDLDVYRLGGQLWHQGYSLYADGSLPFTADGIWLPFTYPPFAALVFTPLGEISLAVGGVILSVVSALCLVYVTVVFLRLLHVGTGANRLTLALWLSAFTIWWNPFGMTLSFGQINLILLVLIVVDLFVLGRTPSAAGVLRGALVGVASAIKLTPLVFLGVFAAGAKWRAMWTGLVAFLTAAVIAAVWLPADSVQYWTYTVFHTGRIGVPEGPINQNLNGAWLRFLGPDNPVAPAAWAMSVVAVTVLAGIALYRTRPAQAMRADPTPLDDVNALLGACVVAFWGLLVAPTTWSHHWVWSLPAVLACAVIAGHSSSVWGARLYGGLALVAVPIFLIGPFQLMPADVATWSWWQQIVGNAYLLWALAFLTALWLKPFRRASL
ncbi:putative mannosyltransferase [Gordonia hirsuta DSM 44140 = NBRC 16056]|uniref:Putative mannosyltransferase n=1 Tax=Gordonia hirsuta DSM 44140 = NBRC 16056 TaxID=1121927 RepID=L7L749_9ACTN|nr:glycosyltransferase 87 family protein [Gordonia hirsuta]GAC55853.1 putative mannosyltransferase [Gordonia hirsuta DSM 44140 = NBRC 16056]